MAKKWRCTVCGYIHEGPEAPDQCPMCKVGKEKFVELVEAEGDLDFVTVHKIGDGKGASPELWEGLQNHFMGECTEVGMYLAMSRQAARVIPRLPRLTSATHGRRPSTPRSSPS